MGGHSTVGHSTLRDRTPIEGLTLVPLSARAGRTDLAGLDPNRSKPRLRARAELAIEGVAQSHQSASPTKRLVVFTTNR